MSDRTECTGIWYHEEQTKPSKKISELHISVDVDIFVPGFSCFLDLVSLLLLFLFSRIESDG